MVEAVVTPAVPPPVRIHDEQDVESRATLAVHAIPHALQQASPVGVPRGGAEGHHQGSMGERDLRVAGGSRGNLPVAVRGGVAIEGDDPGRPQAGRRRGRGAAKLRLVEAEGGKVHGRVGRAA